MSANVAQPGQPTQNVYGTIIGQHTHEQAGLLWGAYHWGTAADVDRAARAARAAFDGHWGQTTVQERVQWLRKLADALKQRTEQIAITISQEVGSPIQMSTNIQAGLPVYFCDPHSPWQRGTNENTNGLLRQYFPRRTDFKSVTQSDLDDVAGELNDRPRQTLKWKSPCQALDEALR